MKISQKQASLLAKEVLKQLTKLRVCEVPQETVEQIKQFKKKRSELMATCKIHDDALAKHESTWHTVVGRSNSDRLYSSDTMDRIIDKLKERETPRLSTIEDEIILNAMFANDDDMKTFIDKIVKKFDKKARVKVS